ncbi:flavodoxin family protein [Simiduia curdlanivorans]|uniref:Flavodoxin family protein n=1 Tax=Simiduia curdlanivorans TaxID=1492769 RepID=A0ABV8V824_9GAMM|nr:flavodoxin family protein [Simiduia curdlanivorans]MDN3639617.1 flavodoxin family protein [Simiduia curdlanivorans]
MVNTRKRILLVYHSQSGNTEKLARAVSEGACEDGECEVRTLMAFQASLTDLLWADGLLFGTPENFGYMSGALKDFFDRTYYPAEAYALNLPFALFISAGNDGTGAEREIQRIAKGYPLRQVIPTLICQGEIQAAHLENAKTLGQTLAAGLSMGIF